MTSSVLKKIIRQIVLSFAILSILLGTISYISIKKNMTSHLILQGKIVGKSILKSIKYEGRFWRNTDYQRFIDDYTTYNSIRYIYILDHSLTPLLSSQSPELHTYLEHPHPTQNTVIDIPEISALQIRIPATHDTISAIVIGMNKTVVSTRLHAILIRILIVVPLLMIVCLGLVYRVVQRVTNPLKQLTKFSKDVEKSQFNLSNVNQKDIEHISKLNDEIGVFATDYLHLYNELDRHISKQTQASAIQKEMNIAHDIQMDLLNAHPTTTNATNLDFSAYIQTANQVGGDFYDVIEKNDMIYLTIGDVSGKGLSAALLAASVLTSIRSMTQFLDLPSDIITSVNQQLSQHNPQRMFVT
ncbi:MAG: PP2C family protein-serine/threonine phosphatase, partial [Candidatus Marinamargulisbacteria bacterium]